MSELAVVTSADQKLRPRKQRDKSIDIIRGFCIVSMILAHVASGGYAYKVTHAAIWIDGAMGFVLLAGLVIGMVYRKVAARRSLRAAQVKALKRGRLVYIGHVTLCAVAFLAAALVPGKAATYATVESQGGWMGALFQALTLQINPLNASILSLYAVLLVLTAPALWAFTRGQWKFVLAASLTLYVVAHFFPDQMTFPRSAGAEGYLNWGTWQALFFIAMAIGWYWSSEGMQSVVQGRAALIVAAAVTVACIGTAQVLVRKEMFASNPIVGGIIAAFEDGDLAPGTLLLSFAAMLTLYRALAWAGRWMPSVLAPFGLLGRQPLGCYIILSITTIAIPFSGAGIAADAYALAVLGVLFAWSFWRDATKAGR